MSVPAWIRDVLIGLLIPAILWVGSQLWTLNEQMIEYRIYVNQNSSGKSAHEIRIDQLERELIAVRLHTHEE